MCVSSIGSHRKTHRKTIFRDEFLSCWIAADCSWSFKCQNLLPNNRSCLREARKSFPSYNPTWSYLHQICWLNKIYTTLGLLNSKFHHFRRSLTASFGSLSSPRWPSLQSALWHSAPADKRLSRSTMNDTQNKSIMTHLRCHQTS